MAKKRNKVTFEREIYLHLLITPLEERWRNSLMSFLGIKWFDRKQIMDLYCFVLWTQCFFPLLCCNKTDTTWDKIKCNFDPGCAIECCCRDKFCFPYVCSGGRVKMTGDHNWTKEGLRLLIYWSWRGKMDLCYLDAWSYFVNWAIWFYGTTDEYESHDFSSLKLCHKYVTVRFFFCTNECVTHFQRLFVLLI